jgi:ABC-type antimicrobial peptide transport system permease subunit
MIRSFMIASVLLLMVGVSSAQVLIATEGFESGNYAGGTGWIGSWNITGSTAILGFTDPYEGNRVSWMRSSGASKQRALDTAGMNQLTLTYAVKTFGLEPGMNGTLFVNGVVVRVWTEVDSDDTWYFYEDNVSVSADTSIIRFEANTANLGDEVWVDAISVYNSSFEACIPDWSCTGFEECVEPALEASCDEVVDLNACGVPYSGDFTEFDTFECVYDPEPPVSGGGGSFGVLDYTSVFDRDRGVDRVVNDTVEDEGVVRALNWLDRFLFHARGFWSWLVTLGGRI